MNSRQKKKQAKLSVVMLIDDSEIDNFINTKMIEGCNFAEKIYVHTSGKSALEFLKNIEVMGESSSHLLPSVIFLDLNMPIMDGLQFIEEFKKMGRNLTSRSKIYLLTASQNPSEIKQVESNKRITKYLPKPLNEQTLSEIAAEITV